MLNSIEENTSSLTPEKIVKFKKSAKKIQKKEGLPYTKALDKVAKANGFDNWQKLQLEADKFRKIEPPTPDISNNFSKDSDVVLSDDDMRHLKTERQGELAEQIKLRVSENRAFLAKKGIEYSIFEPTVTGLKKAIFDATQPVRTHFKLFKFHNYDTQDQGPDNKIIKDAFFVGQDAVKKSKVSLYRPITKKGDPRMWFTGIKDYANPTEQVAIILHNDAAFLVNISQYDLRVCFENEDLIGQFFTDYCETHSQVSQELLSKLKLIAKKPLAAIGTGNTSIGMTIEHALGIPANSSKKPDYKGIEIKSGRGGKTRTTLFAQVADWSRSSCKKSAEILERYGYQREEDFKLYCTLNTQKVNSQGLAFNYDDKSDELHEYHVDDGPVAIWTGDMLRGRLQEKHAETFWIQAESEIVEGQEYFHLKSVVHTKRPLINQLMPLIQSGVVTMDHLIKRTGGDKPKVSEKGPLFKMDKRNLSLLFPEPVTYSLVD